MSYFGAVATLVSKRPLGRWFATAGACVLALAGGVVAASPASASTPYNGVCEVGEFCLYYNSGAYGYGSVEDSDYSDSALEDNYFRGAGRGYGQVVSNNAAAFWNRTPGHVYVYTRVNFYGTEGSIPAGTPRKDFSLGYKNNVESFFIGR